MVASSVFNKGDELTVLLKFLCKLPNEGFTVLLKSNSEENLPISSLFPMIAYCMPFTSATNLVNFDTENLVKSQ